MLKQTAKVDLTYRIAGTKSGTPRFAFVLKRIGNQDPHPMAVPLECKQIHEEAGTVFYKTNTFSSDINALSTKNGHETATYILTWMENIGEGNKLAVRSVNIMLGTSNMLEFDQSYQVAHRERCAIAFAHTVRALRQQHIVLTFSLGVLYYEDRNGSPHYGVKALHFEDMVLEVVEQNVDDTLSEWKALRVAQMDHEGRGALHRRHEGIQRGVVDRHVRRVVGDLTKCATDDALLNNLERKMVNSKKGGWTMRTS